MAAREDRVIVIQPDVHAFVGGGGRGYRSFGYALAMGDFSVLIDATEPDFIPLLEPYPCPRYLLLTHKHTRVREVDFEERFGVKVYLHPADACQPRDGPSVDTPQASRYHDPMVDPDLPRLGFRFVHLPGHTAGYTLIFWKRHGGILFSGDSIIGPRHGDPRELLFPPLPVSDDDAQLRRRVKQLERPRVRHILPLHGEPLIDLDDAELARMWHRLVTEESRIPAARERA